MLMMRRHEKDFMLRGDARYGDDMKNRAGEFAAQLAAANIPDAAKSDLTHKLAAYQADFFAWLTTAQLIAEEQAAVSADFAAIEPVIDVVD
jgi:methyl-accepting chemotaxis protein